MDELLQHVIETINRDRDEALVLRDASPCAGGDINQAARLDCGATSVFLKYHQHAPDGMFEAEADGLRAMAETDAVRVPAVLAVGAFGDTDFLALEYLPLQALAGRATARLGRRLARMHRHTGPAFGWHRDNTIGRTAQPNPREDDWLTFYATHRLRFQVVLLESTGRAGDLVAETERLIERLPALFGRYRPEPSLLHGDLWGGNAAALADGTPVIFDPACYWGDRETDIAMTELFGGFGPDFRDAYEREWPLDPGYARRKPLYQLYHVLNHANLFGGGYVERAQHLTRRLLDETA